MLRWILAYVYCIGIHWLTVLIWADCCCMLFQFLIKSVLPIFNTFVQYAIQSRKLTAYNKQTKLSGSLWFIFIFYRKLNSLYNEILLKSLWKLITKKNSAIYQFETLSFFALAENQVVTVCRTGIFRCDFFFFVSMSFSRIKWN